MMLLYRLTYSVFFWLKRMKRSEKMGILHNFFAKFCDTYSYYFRLLLNKKFIPYFKTHPVKCGLNTKKRDESYTVSLTSFPKRIEYVWIAIDTLMRQNFKPDRIVLWLSNEQFPDGKIPESIEQLKEKGLTVRFCDELRSHKKYYYCFKEYPNDNIITVDDDMFYPVDFIKTLVKYHKKYPHDIIANSVQIIYPQMISPPTEWIVAKNYDKRASRNDFQAFTGAGALFPPNTFCDEAFDKTKVKSLAFTADDLWLKAMSLISGVKTTKIFKFRAFNVGMDIPDNETLFSVNKADGDNLNNMVWQSLVEEYDLGKYDLE